MKKPTVQCEEHLEIDDAVYHITQAVRLMRSAEFLSKSLCGKRLIRKIILDLTSTQCYLEDEKKCFS